MGNGKLDSNLCAGLQSGLWTAGLTWASDLRGILEYPEWGIFPVSLSWSCSITFKWIPSSRRVWSILREWRYHGTPTVWVAAHPCCFLVLQLCSHQQGQLFVIHVNPAAHSLMGLGLHYPQLSTTLDVCCLFHSLMEMSNHNSSCSLTLTLTRDGHFQLLIHAFLEGKKSARGVFGCPVPHARLYTSCEQYRS